MNPAWEAYLTKMEASKRLPSAILQAARTIVDHVGETCSSAGPTPEGHLQLVWDRDEHHLELEVGDGKFEWFYRNRKTEFLDGADDCVLPFSPELSAHFLVVVGAPGLFRRVCTQCAPSVQ